MKRSHEVIAQWIEKIPGHDWFALAASQKEKLVKEVEHFGKGIMAKITESPLFAHSDDLAHLFSIPTRRDMQRLERKLAKIEERVDSLAKGAPRPSMHG